MRFDPKDFRQSIHHKDGDLSFYSLPALAKTAGADLNRLPYSIRVLLESALRNNDNFKVTDNDVERLLTWSERLQCRYRMLPAGAENEPSPCA